MNKAIKNTFFHTVFLLVLYFFISDKKEKRKNEKNAKKNNKKNEKKKNGTKNGKYATKNGKMKKNEEMKKI